MRNASDGLKFFLHLNFLCFLVCYVCIYISGFTLIVYPFKSLYLKKDIWLGELSC